MIKKLLCYLMIFIGLQSYSTHKGVFIVVHGTWGIDSPWCKPGGDFFDALESVAQKFDAKVISYMWPGYLNHDSRQLAAQGLAKLIKSYPAHIHITIFAHSHGGNVSILASQILAKDKKNKHHIDALYTLGTPISHVYYAPDMNIIKRVYNFFSFADMVQPVLGIFGRIFPDHSRIANIRLMIDGKEPGHLELCTALTARWLPHIHEDLARNHIGNFQHFQYSTPGIIFLTTDAPPLYSVDSQRNALIERDSLLTQQIVAHVVRNKSDERAILSQEG